MRFVIDETSWRFNGLLADECTEALETMLDLLDDAEEQGLLACYSEDLFSIRVLGDKCFYDLYEAESPIPISWEIRERIATIFGKLQKWQELPLPWPPAFEVRIGEGAEEYAPSVAWAHEQTVHDPTNAIACVVFPTGRQFGSIPVEVDSKVSTQWFVANSQSYRDFFRWLIVTTTKNPAEMEGFAPSAFPTVDFVAGAFNGIKNMSKPYRELVRPLVLHLSAFSDHGSRIFSGPWQRVSAEFGALGVDISDENGNTKGDRVARQKRTIAVNGTDIIFWWHSKIEPHQDRIHIYPDKVSSGGHLLVGIFCLHL
ncbi:hypothetical protein GURASL_01330 [Geotalea uraniireducens]|uniref:Uncharacterized protein n=1 Tax=Geotalea uraniireducens TaxID=351604 RepID=A0ABM8EFN6_9BACT|nr:hypothetical protein [Geotalea uraniireducens]BDV41210.1 hypothetical protein GURASL_01330 [Geotalea uraniireducens]